MATPTIEAISTQDITIDTDYELEVSITGDPEEVTVGGLLEGFYYSWDADNDTLTIAGEATRLLGDAIWEVSAKETPTSAAVTREITYNVVSGAPIIVAPVGLKISRGYDYDDNPIEIEILNRSSVVKIETLLVGLKFEASDTGVLMKGIHPTGLNLTTDSGTLNIFSSNDGGEDTETATYTFTDDEPPTAVLNLSAVGSETSIALDWDEPSDNGGAAIEEYRIRYKESSESNFSDWIYTGDTITSYILQDLESEISYDIQVSAVTDAGTSLPEAISTSTTQVIYLSVDFRVDVFTLIKTDEVITGLTHLRGFNRPSGLGGIDGIAFGPDGNLYLLDDAPNFGVPLLTIRDHRIGVVSPAAADDSTPIELRNFQLPIAGKRVKDLTIDPNGNIYVLEITGIGGSETYSISVWDSETPDDTEATLIRRFGILPNQNSLGFNIKIGLYWATDFLYVSGTNASNTNIIFKYPANTAADALINPTSSLIISRPTNTLSNDFTIAITSDRTIIGSFTEGTSPNVPRITTYELDLPNGTTAPTLSEIDFIHYLLGTPEDGSYYTVSGMAFNN